jgi:hypothetical protein
MTDDEALTSAVVKITNAYTARVYSPHWAPSAPPSQPRSKRAWATTPPHHWPTPTGTSPLLTRWKTC